MTSPLLIQIDLNDLFVEVDTIGHDSHGDERHITCGLDIAEQLRSHLQSVVINRLREMVKDKLDNLITSALCDRLDLAVNTMVDQQLATLDVTTWSNGRFESVSALIQHQLNRFDYEDKAAILIKQLATKQAEEIKKTFDARYAVALVEGLNKQGLLNAEAAKLLITK